MQMTFSSSRNKYYLGGVVALLLQGHCTMSLKSVCSSRYMVTDQHVILDCHYARDALLVWYMLWSFVCPFV